MFKSYVAYLDLTNVTSLICGLILSPFSCLLLITLTQEKEVTIYKLEPYGMENLYNHVSSLIFNLSLDKHQNHYDREPLLGYLLDDQSLIKFYQRLSLFNLRIPFISWFQARYWLFKIFLIFVSIIGNRLYLLLVMSFVPWGTLHMSWIVHPKTYPT